jgi:hypothetical protein
VGGSAGSIAWVLLSQLLEHREVLSSVQREHLCTCAEAVGETVASALLQSNHSHLLCFVAGLLIIPIAEAIVGCRRRASDRPLARRPQGRLHRSGRPSSSGSSGGSRQRRGRSQSQSALHARARKRT